MNFFNRAIKNVTRKLSTTILLIITFFVIGNFVIIGLSVAKASESAKILTRKKMRAVVKYEIDYDSFYQAGDQIEDEDERNEFFNNYPSIYYKDVKDILKDTRVKTANAITTNSFYAPEGGIDFVRLNNKYEDSYMNSGQQCYMDENGNSICETYIEPTFITKANFFPDMIEFSDGDYSVKQGRFYSQEEINNGSKVCLITEALAKANGLSVGEHITLQIQQLNKEYEAAGITTEDVTCDFQIIGIYSHNNAITPDNSNFDYLSPCENPDNMILTPSSTLYNISTNIQQKLWEYYKNDPDNYFYQDEANKPQVVPIDDIPIYDITFLLNDPLEVDQFVEEYNMNPGEYKKFTANNEEFEKLSKPLDTLSDYANFIVWLVVINSVVIITLVTALTLKTREYEIGVLLSVGASKLKVILQFFIELALVALIGFTLSIASGSVISKKVGGILLDNQIQSSGIVEEENWGGDYYSPWDNDYTTDITLEDIMSEYDVTVSPLIIAEIYVVGLGIVLVSVIIPSFMIMRYNPKKILMNQY